VIEFSSPGIRESAETGRRLVFTVSELTARINELLERHFLLVWVEGEISQLKKHDSGHVFFSLRDGRALLRVVLFRDQAREIPFPLREGLRVLCFGRISVYPPRGEYRLIARRVEPLGAGVLQAAFEALKEELRRLGYFDPERKRPLPSFPERVGVVTSLSGAALHDFLRVALSRWPARILVHPVRVQGEGAAEEIAAAIHRLNEIPDLDLIVVTRGGGSLEDLWAFNERTVAEAVYRSRLPVVSAVGHEVDYTICDFVADHRAPTPTAAAALVFPERERLIEEIRRRYRKLTETILRRLAHTERELHHLRGRLRDPGRVLAERSRHLRELSRRLTRSLLHLVATRETELSSLARHLEAVSPLAVLGRGYGLVRRVADRRIVRRAEEVSPGERLEIILSRGRILARTEEVKP